MGGVQTDSFPTHFSYIIAIHMGFPALSGQIVDNGLFRGCQGGVRTASIGLPELYSAHGELHPAAGDDQAKVGPVAAVHEAAVGQPQLGGFPLACT